MVSLYLFILSASKGLECKSASSISHVDNSTEAVGLPRGCTRRLPSCRLFVQNKCLFCDDIIRIFSCDIPMMNINTSTDVKADCSRVRIAYHGQKLSFEEEGH